MKNVRVARRYAAALMAAGEESRSVDVIADDLRTVGSMLEGSRELRSFIASPIIPAKKKVLVMRGLFEKVVGKEVMTFFLLLTEKRREDILRDIVQQFMDLLDKRQGIVEAAVKSASTIDKEQEQLLKKRLEAHTAKKVRMQFALDPSLKGGLVIQIGDTVLDGSVRHQLELLKDRFVAGGHIS
jgi:F-type H+-transporting ATPase subunit delta